MTAAAHRRVDFDRDHIDVNTMITELVDQHSHRESYDYDAVQPGGAITRWSRGHITRVRPLLEQLTTATPAPAGDDAPMGGGFESQPAAHLESLDTLMLVDAEASRIVRVAGLDDAGLTTAECVRKVGALMASMDRCGPRSRSRTNCCAWHDAERDVRRWWAQARIVAGWDSAAWRPDATCLACSRRGGLRVRLSSKVATCIECRETWDPTTIGLLAEHIRVESFAVARASRPLPCAPVEGYEPDGIGALCPACGSMRCQRAVATQLVQTSAA